jgi:HAD-superfamily class IIA hydrolase, TIGR01459
MKPLRFVEHLNDLVAGIDVVLSDIWGVVHNGVVSFPEACEALRRFRMQGGTVILITNAPRPADSVQRQLRKLGVADEIYDAIVSSGDLTRHFVAERAGQAVFWLGPERDNSIYRGLDPVLTPLEQADYIVCTGPFDDEVETAEDYRQMMSEARKRNLTLVCANPDIVVERGDRLVICAGAIAELYREIGGEVVFYGKPHRPIYQRALALATDAAAPRRRSAGCWQSAIRCAPTLPARRRSGSSACS